MDYKNLIVVGVDGSPGSRRALRWALAEANRSGADLEAVTVWTWDGLEGPMLAATNPTAQRDHADRVSAHEVQTAVADVGAPARVNRTVVEGHPVRELIAASRHARLLVLGSHGHGRLHRAVLGSISEQCARRAPCPVVLVPAPAAADKADSQPVAALQP
jgi:nucleotide-binding universal stress UspA family protein